MAFFIGNSFCKLCQNNEENLQNEFLFCSNSLRTKGLFPPYKSFHSTRLPHSNKILITPLAKSNLNKETNNNNNYNSNYFKCNFLDIDNVLNSIDNFFDSLPEIKLHSKLYKYRPDVNAIFHTNSPFTITSFRNGKLENVHGEAALILGDIPIINFEQYETEDLENNTEEIEECIAKSSIGEPLRPIRTIILKKNGVIALGACLHEARAFVEILEEWARFNIYSRLLRYSDVPIRTLSLEQLRSLGGRYARSIKFSGRQSPIGTNSSF
jgi:ribulose-5-phosphate 4-epimerase/fuculose-1-phosphate aldolase